MPGRSGGESTFADVGELIEPGQQLDRLIDQLTALTETDAPKPCGHQQSGFDELRSRQQSGINFGFKDRVARNGRAQSPVGSCCVAVLVLESEVDPSLSRSAQLRVRGGIRDQWRPVLDLHAGVIENRETPAVIYDDAV